MLKTKPEHRPTERVLKICKKKNTNKPMEITARLNLAKQLSVGNAAYLVKSIVYDYPFFGTVSNMPLSTSLDKTVGTRLSCKSTIPLGEVEEEKKKEKDKGSN